MVGYLAHNTISIRVRSGGFDVGLEGGKAFVTFDTLADAKAFIDAGRQVDGQTVYDINTQAAITTVI
jgi:hypothetical protein